MLTKDLVSDREPESLRIRRAVGVFRRKKRIEDMLQVVGRNALSIVLDLNTHMGVAIRLVSKSSPDDYFPAAFVEGIQGVEKEVDHDLFDLLAVDQNTRQMLGQFSPQLNATAGCIEGNEGQTGRNQFVYVLFRGGMHHVTGIVQDIL